MSIIDQEIKKLVFTLFIACFFVILFAWVASNGNSFLSFTTKVYNTLAGIHTYDEPYKNNLDKNKNYTLTVGTSQGDMKFLLYKNDAPNTVNNIVNLVKDGFYKKADLNEKSPEYILFGKSNNSDVKYTIKEEINAKSLGLDTINVSQYYGVLKNVYDETILQQNNNKSVKDFYESLGYSYSENITSKPIVKGSIVAYGESPNSFGNKFIVSTKGPLPAFEGRMTNFGEITSGQDVLDKLSSAKSEDIFVTNISIDEK